MEDSWSNLASSVVAFASQQSGIPGTSEASQVILALCGIEDEQTAMLRRIQGDVTLLRMGPLRSGRVHLQAADRKGSAHPDYQYHTVLRSRRIDTLLAATHLVGPFIIMRSLRKLNKANEAAAALEGYVPFVNTVTQTANAIQQTVKQDVLKLREVPGTRTEYRRYELEWAPVK